MKLPVPISFDWDKGNLEKIWKRHKVYYKEAEEVFFNKPLKIFPDMKHSGREKRFMAHGATNRRRALTIIFTIRNEKIRVISGRNQSRKERKIYEKKD